MSTVLKLTSITFNEESIDIEFDWNGSPCNYQFASLAAMSSVIASPIETPYEAVKFMLTGLIAKEPNPANFGNHYNMEFSIAESHVTDDLAGAGGFLRWTVSP